VDLIRVVDAQEETAKAVGADLDVEWATDYEQLLGDPAIRGVVIATPTSLHAEMISQAARAGKHVFTEKPLSLDVASGVAAVATAKANEVNLQVGFHRHFEPDWEEAWRRIQAGELGEIYFWRSAHRDPIAPTDTSYVATMGNLIVEMLIHDVDCARWMVGEIVEVAAIGASVVSPIFEDAGDVDHAVIALRFASGAIGVIDGSRASGYGHECSTEILGSKATVRMGDGRQGTLEWLTPGASTHKQIVDYRVRSGIAYSRELEDFASCIAEERPPRVTGEDAIAAFIVAQAADDARRERRTISVNALDSLRQAMAAI
jgi:myo-inositol 2-dehydrogenase/D-chiro-inositol 1-dehydrogenase